MHGSALRLWTVAFLTLAAPSARLCSAEIVVGPGQARAKIQEGIEAAVDGDVVLVKPSTYKEVVDFKGKKIKVVSESGAEATIIDAAEPTSTAKSSVVVFKNGENDQSVLEGFTVTHGTGFPLTSAAQLLGGGILIDKCTPVIRNCIIKSNTAHKGGGIFVAGIGSGGLIEGCEISENKSLITSGGSGAGINVTFTGTGTEVLTIKDCRFIKNNAAVSGTVWGGGAYLGGTNAKAKVIVDGCTFEENLVGLTTGVATSSGGDGGGVFLDTILIEMRGGDVTNNKSLNGGGIAIRNQGLSSSIQGTRIQGNEAIGSGGGGGLYFPTSTSSRLTISKCEISQNTAATDGGGIWIAAGGPVLDGCKLIDNSANGVGGGIRYLATIKAKVNATLFQGNRASNQGGGVYVSSSSSAPVVYANCIFLKNSSGTQGGAVFNKAPSSAILKFFYCTFYANSTGPGAVGGIHFDTGGTAVVTNSILWGNTPSDYPPTSAASISYSVLEVPGSLTPVRPGMVFDDPQFVAPDAGTPDFHLKDTSPALDKGTEGVDIDLKPPPPPMPPPIPGDYDGNLRIADGPDDDQLATPDMGALEFQSGPVVHPKFVRGLCRHPGADLAVLSATDLNVADAIYLLRYKFGGLYPEPGCLKACDADDNGQLNETDAIYVLNYLFHGSNLPPKQPFPALDTDPTPDALSCVKGKIE